MLLEVGLAFLLLGPTLVQDDEGDAGLRRDAAYARALAAELGFHDLAETVIDRALTRAGSGNDRGLLLLTRCEVRKLIAQRPTDPDERLAAYGAAAEAYGEFLATDPAGSLANQAQVDLAQVAFQYGDTLSRVLGSERAPTGDTRTQLVTQAETVFDDALDGVNQLIKSFNAMSPSEEKENLRFSVYYPSSFFRSLIYYYWALLYGQGSLERNENCRLAIEYLESFIFEVGQNSRAGLLGFKYMADCYAARGDQEREEDYDSAEIYYQYVVENHIPDPPGQLAPAELDARRGVAQESYYGYVQFLNERGRGTEAFQVGQDFRQWLDDENVLPNDAGWRVLLQLARVHADHGQFTQALELTREVASENEQSILRLEANELERWILRRLPDDVEVDLAVLYGAAEGAYFQDKFQEAVEGFRRLLPRLMGSQKSDDYAASTYYYLGRAWEGLGRELEAAVTFQAGYDEHSDTQDGEFAQRLANRWYALAERLTARNRNDAVLDQFLRDALAAKTEASGGDTPDAALWRQAQTHYNFAKGKARDAKVPGPGSPAAREALQAFDRAITSFKEIPKSSQRYYEKALVNIGMCHFRKTEFDSGSFEPAFKAFDDYLQIYTADPTNNPIDNQGRKSRADAEAQADFYRGQVRLRQAKSGEGDTVAAWKEVLRLYNGYFDTYPDQRDYGAASAYHRLEAQLALGDIARAEAEYEGLVRDNASANWVNAAAFGLYSFYYKASQVEGADSTPLLVKAVSYLHLSNEADASKNWQNLVQEARLRLALGEPSTAATILQGVLRDYKSDPKFAGPALFHAKLDFVKALLDQDKAGAAAPFIDELKAERPNNLDVKQAFVKVKVGWLALRDGEVIEVPGVGTAEAFAVAEVEIVELQTLADNQARTTDVNKYEFCPFWDAQLQAAYFLYKRSQVDSSFAGKHRSRIEALERLAPSLGADSGCEETAELLRWLKNR